MNDINTLLECGWSHRCVHMSEEKFTQTLRKMNRHEYQITYSVVHDGNIHAHVILDKKHVKLFEE